MTRERTLTSGEMVRESGLSIKALRLYDAKGLLVPAEVDPRSGYRRYAVAQLERARRIALLRRLEMPLAMVAEVIDADPDRARKVLLAWWMERQDGLAAQRATALEVARSLGAVPEGEGPVAAALRPIVRFRDVPERTVASITSETSQADLVPTFTADALAIRQHLADLGAEPGAGHTVIYHQVPMGDVPGRIETCVPYDGAAAPAGGIVLRVDGARTEAYLEVPLGDCGFPQIVGYHEALYAEGSAPTRELYYGTWSDDPGDVVAEVVAEVADELTGSHSD